MTIAADLRARAADARQQVLDLGPSLAQRPPQPAAPGAASQPISAALLASAPERIDWTPRPMRVGSEDRYPSPEFVPDPNEFMLESLRSAVGQPYRSAPLPPHWAAYRWQRYESNWVREAEAVTRCNPHGTRIRLGLGKLRWGLGKLRWGLGKLRWGLGKLRTLILNGC